MKLYLECNMGAAGDMLMAALLELLPDRDLFLQRMRSLGLPNVQIDCDFMTKCGITGTKMRIRIGGVEEKSEDAVLSSTGVEHSERHMHGHSHTNEHPHIHKESHHEHVHGETDHVHTHEHTHDHSHTHTHYSYSDVCEIIENLDLAENVK